MTYYVYIVECSDGSFYTGVTNNLDRRIWAISWEKQLKGWNRKKKEALFEQNWDLIKELSKSKSNNQSSTDSD